MAQTRLLVYAAASMKLPFMVALIKPLAKLPSWSLHINKLRTMQEGLISKWTLTLFILEGC